jgi:hypothetical protein
MKKLLYFSLLLIFLTGCKNDKDDNTPEPLIKPLVGKWLLKQTELTVNGKKVWQPAPASQPVYLLFRSDGIILNADGKASCCGPKELKINGGLYEIKPQTTVVYSLDCTAVDCFACPTFDIEYAGNEMIISSCFDTRIKYVRV